MASGGLVPHIPPEINAKLQSMLGRSISSLFVRGKRLCIGFGRMSEATTIAHGEWEIGTYECSRRIVQESRVTCASNDPVDTPTELEEALKACDLGEFSGIQPLSEFDTRFVFTGGNVDILCTISDEDELLHIFLPEKEVVTLSVSEGWILGRSDRPWRAT